MSAGQPAYWTDREPGEPVADWVTRLAACYLVSKSFATLAGRRFVPVRPRGCGEYHAGECTSEYPYAARMS